MNKAKIIYPVLAAGLLALILPLLLAVVPARADYYQEEMDEAIAATEDQWNAVRQTMQDGSKKLKDFKENYQKYEDQVFSQDMEKGIALVCKLLGCDASDKSTATKYLWKVREMFNTLDRNGLKDYVGNVSEKLEFADKVAGEVTNAWEFSKKFNPAHAKENPTYGLRLIGSILKDGVGQFEKIPLVGKILGPWVKAYGEVAEDFANALDRLNKKIREFRQNSLCGQLGMWTSEQKAFDQATKEAPQYAGEDCLVYFESKTFRRLQGTAYEGGGYYYLYDPRSEKGFFAPIASTEKVYRWHDLWINRKALYADWLANRARSVKPEVENRARRLYGMFKGWINRTDPGWVIIDALKMMEQVREYRTWEEEKFVANYILDSGTKTNVEKIVTDYEEHVFASGTVYVEDEDGSTSPASGATIEITLDGITESATTGANGTYDILLRGKPMGAVSVTVSKDGYDDIKRTGKFPDRVVLGWDFTLRKGVSTITVSGYVFDSSDPAQPVALEGAAVTASGAGADQGSTVSGADGSFQMTITVAPMTTVTLTATKDVVSGSTSAVAMAEGVSGLSIMLDMSKALEEEEEPATWTINVLVVDGAGKPLGNATVTNDAGAAAVTTGADGSATVGPIEVTPELLTVTLSSSVVAEGGVTVTGGAVTLSYEGEPVTAVTLTIPVLIPQMVTIGGTVVDANGIPIDGAAVTTSRGGSTASAGGGVFGFAPISMMKDSAVVLTAVLTEGQNSYGSTPVTVVFDGANTNISTQLVIDVEAVTEVDISGRVVDMNGQPLQGAVVTGAGQSTVTNGSGRYTLSGCKVALGGAVKISATVTTEDGSTAGGEGTAVPKDFSASAPDIVIGVVQEEEDTEDIDDALDDLTDDKTPPGVDLAQAWTNFTNYIANLDGVGRSFYVFHDFFMQRIREGRESVCGNFDVVYSLNQAGGILGDYEGAIDALPGIYGELSAAMATAETIPPEVNLASAESEYNRAYEQMYALRIDHADMAGQYNSYECDEDADAADADGMAENGINPADIEGGSEGLIPKPEECGDGIDNDLDGQIDECDAGCCTQNVQVKVEDCGSAADDIFYVNLPGEFSGYTPKGYENTWDAELDPGVTYTVTVTCVDDGGTPLGSDVGTACITVIVFGATVIGGGERRIDYQASIPISFEVPATDAAPGVGRTFNGATLKHLEGGN